MSLHKHNFKPTPASEIKKGDAIEVDGQVRLIDSVTVELDGVTGFAYPWGTPEPDQPGIYFFNYRKDEEVPVCPKQ